MSHFISHLSPLISSQTPIRPPMLTPPCTLHDRESGHREERIPKNQRKRLVCVRVPYIHASAWFVCPRFPVPVRLLVPASPRLVGFSFLDLPGLAQMCLCAMMFRDPPTYLNLPFDFRKLVSIALCDKLPGSSTSSNPSTFKSTTTENWAQLFRRRCSAWRMPKSKRAPKRGGNVTRSSHRLRHIETRSVARHLADEFEVELTQLLLAQGQLQQFTQVKRETQILASQTFLMNIITSSKSHTLFIPVPRASLLPSFLQFLPQFLNC